MISTNDKIKLCSQEYSKTPNIKIVANKTGIKWQTVYWYLKKAGINVKGDKSTYGSVKDKFAHNGEEYIQKILPSAINQNLFSYQPKIDFIIGNKTLEVKSSKFLIKDRRWNFSLKKQKKIADYFILLAFDSCGVEVKHHFLVPNELLIETIQTISICKDVERSKWGDFLISKGDLIEFFEETIIN